MAALSKQVPLRMVGERTADHQDPKATDGVVTDYHGLSVFSRLDCRELKAAPTGNQAPTMTQRAQALNKAGQQMRRHFQVAADFRRVGHRPCSRVGKDG